MSKLLRTIRRLQNPRDLWLFLQILYMLTILPRRIQRMSMPDLLTRMDAGVDPAPSPEAKLKITVGFVDSLLRYRHFQRYGKCLLRSLVLFKFLRRQGWPVEIHFGVRKTGDASDYGQTVNIDITGHSWLMMGGEVFLEDGGHVAGFATTYKFPPPVS